MVLQMGHIGQIFVLVGDIFKLPDELVSMITQCGFSFFGLSNLQGGSNMASSKMSHVGQNSHAC